MRDLLGGQLQALDPYSGGGVVAAEDAGDLPGDGLGVGHIAGGARRRAGSGAAGGSRRGGGAGEKERGQAENASGGGYALQSGAPPEERRALRGVRGRGGYGCVTA
ncbi:hypothetical protein GCM10017752_11870 [Streptomyces roseoviridis]